MAEPVGMCLAVLAAFDNTVQCFDAIAIARSFDRDFHSATLKLDVARLRLSRWGRSIGLAEVNRDLPYPLSISGTPDDHTKAREILDQILKLFHDAETKSSKLKLADKSQYGDDSLDFQTRRLHTRLMNLSLASFKPHNVFIKTKWALHHEKHLRRLIEDITEHIDNLTSLFPAAGPVVAQRCVEEARVLGEEEEDIAILKPIVAEQDPDLGKVLEVYKAKGSQSFHFSFAGTTNYGMQQGYFTGTQTNNFGFIGGPKGAGVRNAE